MKKTKRPQGTKPVVEAEAPQRSIVWWPWAAAIAALIAVYQIYAPSMSAPFVLDDRYLPYFAPNASVKFWDWVGYVRPLLMASYWVDFTIAGGSDPFNFHVTNVAIHFLTSVVAVLIVAQLVKWAGVSGKMRWGLAIFAGAVFLLHPMQAEAVAYTSGRSDALSTLFYYGAFAAFIYRRNEAIGWLDAVIVLLLFGAAIGTKENTLTLPALFLVTDYFWGRGGLVKNRILYGLLAIAAAIGAKMVWTIIRAESTAGFHTEGLTPATFFFTECRVVCRYILMFFVPAGQNVDPDIPISQTLFDHGAIVGLAVLVALAAAAWIYRKKYPLAAFGIFVFLLLISPTSSFVPIKDVMSERRLYLPMIGLLLVCCEALRRVSFKTVVQVGAVAAVVFSVLTYKRSEVWASPMTLWGDAVAKSPNKYRPHFQLAFAQFERQQCAVAERGFEKASHLQQPPPTELLVDWALALDCIGRQDTAIEKLQLALQRENTAHLHTQIARVQMRKQQWQAALAELAIAQQLDPNYDMTYLYRGNIYQIAGDKQAALVEIKRALQLNPSNQIAQQALVDLSR